MIEKGKRGGLRQTVSLLAYLFPSINASQFELEAPFTLEETVRRLNRLERVRVSREVSLGQAMLSEIMDNSERSGAWQKGSDALSTSTAPIGVGKALLDDDTFRYVVQYHDERFNITIKGFMKRWDSYTTLVTGKVYVDTHLISVLVKSLIYAAVGFAIAMIVLFSAQAFLYATPLGYSVVMLLQSRLLVSLMPILFWLVTLSVIWLNDVVVPAQTRRARLVTRIEDMLLIPFLVSE